MNFEEQTRNFEGLWVSKILWFNTELSMQEKMFLLEINSLDNKDHCHASNAYLSQFFNLSPNRCSEIIKQLEGKELIKVTYIREKRAIKKRVLEVLEKGNRVLGKPNIGIRDSEEGYSEKGEERSNSYRSNSNKKNNKKKLPKKPTELDYSKSNSQIKTDRLTEFVAYRKEDKKKPVTQRALTILINEANKHTDSEVTEAINKAISCGYQGVFYSEGFPKPQGHRDAAHIAQTTYTPEELADYARSL